MKNPKKLFILILCLTVVAAVIDLPEKFTLSIPLNAG